MIRRVTSRLTYANVMATIAVFIALGGSSYAVLRLPRNSVGTKQLRPGAVRSSDVRNHTLQPSDFSTRARQALAGPAGPVGPAGPTGPAGANAVKYFASVLPTGRIVRGNANSGGRASNPGTYVIGFPDSVSSCSYFATLGTTDSSTAPAGRITVSDAEGRVGVQTYDASGNATDEPFHLFVAC